MRRRSLNRTLHIARALLLLATVTGFGAVGWFWADPTRVDLLEERLRQQLHGAHHAACDRAQALTDPAARERALDDLLADLAAVRAQDRLAPLKKQALQQLRELAVAGGDPTRVLQRTRELSDFHDHDLGLQVRLAQALLDLPATVPDGLALFDRLAATFPGHPWVAPLHIRTTAKHRGLPAAFAALQRAIAVPDSSRWQVAWDAGTGFDPLERTVAMVPQQRAGRLRLHLVIHEPCTALQFRLPPLYSKRLLAPRLTLGTFAGPQATIDLMTASPDGLRADGDAWIAPGFGNATLTMTLPQRTPENVIVDFTATVEDQPASYLLETLFAPELQGMADALAGTPQDLDLYRRLRGEAAAGATVQLFWRTREQSFAGERAATAPVARGAAPGTWQATLPVGAAADALRIDLPGVVGLQWKLLAIRLDCDPPPHLDPASMRWTQRNDIAIDGAVVTATGTDPYLAFELPQPTAVRSLTVEYEVR